MKIINYLCTAVGVVGSIISTAFGGWSSAITTLVIFMAVDYISGLITAGIFHKSNKTESGKLESRAGWKGLCRKGITLLIVLVACRLDIIFNTTFIRDATAIAFICNEGISIIENAGLMGINIPDVIKNAIEILKEKNAIDVLKKIKSIGDLKERNDNDEQSSEDGDESDNTDI